MWNVGWVDIWLTSHAIKGNLTAMRIVLLLALLLPLTQDTLGDFSGTAIVILPQWSGTGQAHSDAPNGNPFASRPAHRFPPMLTNPTASRVR